jgi:DNA processing protein
MPPSRAPSELDRDGQADAAGDAMDRQTLAAWWCLVHTPQLSRRAARSLLKAFGSPEAVIRGAPSQWRAVAGEAAASALAKALQQDPLRTSEAGWAWHAANPAQHHLVPLDDPAYPPLLLAADDPPLMLYAVGERAGLAALQRESLAIVGSRQATPQGRTDARAFARHLGQAGWVIVSGLAAGIDAAAHEGALEGDALTVAVMGTGPDVVYPVSHRSLAQRIAARGLLLSELPPGTPPRAEHFPRRNRIIAALSRGTLVVEAALQSGSLITARLALESGREVFALPGSIHAPQSRGCHALIRQGAKLVETVTDILEELPPALRHPDPMLEAAAEDGVSHSRKALAGPRGGAEPAEPEVQGPDADLLEALGFAPSTLDALSARTGLPSAELSARLLELELDGAVVRLPGGLFQRMART